MKLSPFLAVLPRIALPMAAALLFAGVAIVWYGNGAYQAQKRNEMTVQAQVLASIATAALAFQDHDAAQEYVNALKANPEIREVAVYDAGGRLFASYSRDGRPRLPGHVTGRPAPGEMLATAPVEQAGLPLGSVAVAAVAEPLGRRIARAAVIGLLATMSVLVVGVLWAAHAVQRRANAELERRAHHLAATNEMLQLQIQERKKAEAALHQAQKMETIGRLTGGVAHDFNNLLQIVLLSLEALLRTPAVRDDPKLHRLVDTASGSAIRGAQLTRQLLAFARRQPLVPGTFNVNDLVARMSNILRGTLGEQVAVEITLAEDLWWASADPHQLESAILNLAVNARDAMPQGGKLGIATSNVRLDRSPDPEDPEPGDYVRVSVTDTGFGMSRDIMARAIDPFFTTKDVGQGSGLGLSQVYGYVKQSGGHLRIDSAVGAGTTVGLYLPRSGEQPSRTGREEERPAVPAAAASAGDTVLVVEDEDSLRATVAESLREFGYRVLAAADGAAALRLLETESGIDILFTDVVMPGGLDGIELALRASRIRPGLKVLLTSAHPRPTLAGMRILGEEAMILQKPYHTQELVAKLRSVMHPA